MYKAYFRSERLSFKPLEEKDICAFRRIADEQHVQQFFQLGDSIDFLDNLNQYACFPVGVFTFSEKKLIGFINGYVYNAHDKEMLVEFFLTERYYHDWSYVTECIRTFVRNNVKIGFRTFRFEVEQEDQYLFNMLVNMPEVRYLEDFIDTANTSDSPKSGRYMRVLKISFK